MLVEKSDEFGPERLNISIKGELHGCSSAMATAVEEFSSADEAERILFS
jgi:hypothetical protein